MFRSDFFAESAGEADRRTLAESSAIRNSEISSCRVEFSEAKSWIYLATDLKSVELCEAATGRVEAFFLGSVIYFRLTADLLATLEARIGRLEARTPSDGSRVRMKEISRQMAFFRAFLSQKGIGPGKPLAKLPEPEMSEAEIRRSFGDSF